MEIKQLWQPNKIRKPIKGSNLNQELWKPIAIRKIQSRITAGLGYLNTIGVTLNPQDKFNFGFLRHKTHKVNSVLAQEQELRDGQSTR